MFDLSQTNLLNITHWASRIFYAASVLDRKTLATTTGAFSIRIVEDELWRDFTFDKVHFGAQKW